ncbi:hypothetical protein [Bifidobacterium miconisargentati]|uniref:hypothetical protein n=1 Tax=Bifidobacterium miconisargentati TaxID=2834437 RepID=UPI001BDCE03C|nr:hypothetical protein [Bifidobacterium miconisargentati]MBW3089248.1 hypothetical protein [Bifidobacterium miconisargentati]
MIGVMTALAAWYVLLPSCFVCVCALASTLVERHTLPERALDLVENVSGLAFLVALVAATVLLMEGGAL